MPKQMLNLSEFSGGLNNLLDPRDIKPSELSEAQNVMCDKNGIIRSVGKGKLVSMSDLEATQLKAGFGLYMFESSFGIGELGSATGSNFKNVSNHDAGENTQESIWYVLIGGRDGINVRTSGTEWVNIGNVASVPDPVTMSMKPIFHIADEGLRISNTDYDARNDSGDILVSQESKNRWFGFIQKKNYFITAGASSSNDFYFNGWFLLDNDIKAPTAFNVSTGEFATADVNNATAGKGFDLYLGSTTGGQHDFSAVQDGSEVKYEFASSFIYDGIQESLLFISGSIVVLEEGHASNNVDIDSHATLSMAVGVKTGYNPRITGGRIYFRDFDSNDEWVLLVDIDFEKGCRASLDDVYPSTPWTVEGTPSNTEDVYISATGDGSNTPDQPIKSTFLNIDSYYTLNEWSPSEPRISIGCEDAVLEDNGYLNETGEGYKCSAIINRRCFIANTALYKNENASTHIGSGELFRERDRIYYSAINKFDCFPRTTHFIDVVRGDAEEYSALIGYADRLLAFKTNTLFIINIASTDPREWFLESQHRGMGIRNPFQVAKTGDGVVWANHTGAYSYTGGDVRTTTTEDISVGADINTLTSGKLDSFNWNVDNKIAVAYHDQMRQLIVIRDVNDTTNTSAYIYDFTTATWTYIGNEVIFPDTEAQSTNLISDFDGKLFYGSFSTEDDAEAIEYVENVQFQQLVEDGTDGYDNGDGTVDGYTW